MIDEPDAEKPKEQAGDFPLRSESASTTQKASHSHNKEQPSPYVMRSLETMRGFLKKVIDFTDDHNGALTAIATIFIAVFTFMLFRVSRYQWITIRETLSYQIQQTRARLFISSVVVHNFPIRPYVTFCLENGGHSLADEIRLMTNRPAGAVGGEQPFGPSDQKPPPTLFMQPSVGAIPEGAKNCNHLIPIVQIKGETPTFDAIAEGTPHTGFWIQIFAGYRDTATGKSDVSTNCVYWDNTFKQFSPCISVVNKPMQ